MDLQTNYLGIKLKNHLVVSSCPILESLDTIKAIEKAGAAAIVMPSVFEEEILRHEEIHHDVSKFVAPSTYFPSIDQQSNFLTNKLSYLRHVVSEVSIPIIGSLGAITASGWIDYAMQMQDIGIQALELNLYCLVANTLPADSIENHYLNIVKEVKSKLRIPVVVKLSPFFTSVGDMAQKLVDIAGVDGLVVFNRYYYPDFNIDSLEFKPDLQLSNSYEARLPLRWVSVLRNKLHNVSIAASTGVDNPSDFIKYIIAGADAVMCASCLIKHGVPYIEYLLNGLEKWLKDKNYSSVKEIQGLMSKNNISDLYELERLQYMKALRTFQREETSDEKAIFSNIKRFIAGQENV